MQAPKFKKAQSVSFLGKLSTGEISTIKKTFIWGFAKEEEGYYYLIQHPLGIEFNDQTAKDFIGFDILKLEKGVKYLSAFEDELTAIEPLVKEVPIEAKEIIVADEKKIRRAGDPQFTISMTKAEWETASQGMAMYKMVSETQKVVIMMQAGLSEEDYQNLIIDIKLFIGKLKEIGIVVEE